LTKSSSDAKLKSCFNGSEVEKPQQFTERKESVMPVKKLRVIEKARSVGATPDEIKLELLVGETEEDGGKQVSLPITIGNVREAKVVEGGVEIVTLEGAPIYVAIKAPVSFDF
jgi:hypothetical protein